MTPSLSSLLWFALVLLLIPVGLLVLKRTPLGQHIASRALPAGRIVGSTALGPQQRLVAIEVGEGESRRWVLIGVTPQQISHVLTSTTPLAVSAAPTVEASAPSEAFQMSLQKALTRWRSPQV